MYFTRLAMRGPKRKICITGFWELQEVLGLLPPERHRSIGRACTPHTRGFHVGGVYGAPNRSCTRPYLATRLEARWNNEAYVRLERLQQRESVISGQTWTIVLGREHQLMRFAAGLLIQDGEVVVVIPILVLFRAVVKHGEGRWGRPWT